MPDPNHFNWYRFLITPVSYCTALHPRFVTYLYEATTGQCAPRFSGIISMMSEHVFKIFSTDLLWYIFFTAEKFCLWRRILFLKTINMSPLASSFVRSPVDDTVNHHLHHHDLHLHPDSDLQMNQRCRVCGEKAAGFHFGAFTCEGCKVCLSVWNEFLLKLKLLVH